MPMKGHRRSSSYGSTGDTAAMMGGGSMTGGFGLRHGASYSEIPIVYDYQFLAPPTQDLYYDREALFDRAVDLLDPDLRPIPPQPNCADSMQIYQNHRQMAADFVKVQTDLMDLKRSDPVCVFVLFLCSLVLCCTVSLFLSHSRGLPVNFLCHFF